METARFPALPHLLGGDTTCHRASGKPHRTLGKEVRTAVDNLENSILEISLAVQWLRLRFQCKGCGFDLWLGN